TKTLEGNDGDQHAAHRPTPLALETPSMDDPEHEQLLQQAAATGRLTAVQPDYLCLQGRRAFTVLDPRTGRELWSRTGVSPTATILGARDYVCLLEHDVDRVTVFRARDGQTVEAPGVAARLKRALRIEGNDLVLLEPLPGLR